MEPKQEGFIIFFFLMEIVVFFLMAILGMMGAFPLSPTWIVFAAFGTLFSIGAINYCDVGFGKALTTKWFSPKPGRIFSAEYYDTRQDGNIEIILYDHEERKKIFCVINKEMFDFQEREEKDFFPDRFIFLKRELDNGHIRYVVCGLASE
ncbi:MAG: hypothetical protein Q8O83_02995 [bacterium]|nr:hypothetical protein [bacterium]